MANKLVSVDEATLKMPDGVIERLAQDLGQTGTILDARAYGVVADGTTNDTANFQAAVSAAYALRPGAALYVPGPVLTLSPINNLWNVRLVGPGSIVRGATTFVVEPLSDSGAPTERHIYVNGSTGSDTNDGIAPASAFKSLAPVRRLIQGLTADQAAMSRWVVNISGTINGGVYFDRIPNFPQGLVFRGQALSSGRPVTQITKGTGAPDIGIRIEPGTRLVIVERIKFVGFSNGFNGYGLLMKGNGELNAFDCEAVGCDTGFAAIRNVDFAFIRCYATTNTGTFGFRVQYSSSGVITHSVASGASIAGVHVTRGTVAHVDYCTLTDNAVGIDVDMGSRVAPVESHFQRNVVAIRAQGAAEWVDTDNVFYTGTANANTSVMEHYGAGRETRLYSQQPSRNEWRIGSSFDIGAVSPVDVTGTTSDTPAYVGSWLGALPPSFINSAGKKIRAVVYGEIVGTALTTQTTIRLSVIDRPGTNRANLIGANLPVGLTGAFALEMTAFSTGTNTQRVMVSLNGSIPRVATGTNSVSFVDERLFRLYVQPGDTSATIRLHSLEIFVTG